VAKQINKCIAWLESIEQQAKLLETPSVAVLARLTITFLKKVPPEPE